MQEPGWDLPRLDYYINAGCYTGSKQLTEQRDFTKELRYKILVEKQTLKTYAWLGPNCFEKSEILQQAEFPVSEDGLQSANRWVKDLYEKWKQELA